MELDLFINYELQREELLARIAQSLQLDESKKKRMEVAYGSVSSILSTESAFFKGLDVDVYPQGSVASGTTVKPLSGAEFDLDIVVHIKSIYSRFTPNQIYTELVNLLENDGRYKDKVEKKKRCVRLNYANDFHMDIMPGCIKFVGGSDNIKVPDRELKNWVDSNPKGFVEWFLKRSIPSKQSLLQEFKSRLFDLKAEVADLPDNDFYNKTPLQRSVQLIKRYRDIYFENDDTYCTSSIVLTTLMGHFYGGENTIYDTLENTVQKIRLGYQNSIKNVERFKVFNPVNGSEEFTDKWSKKHYDNFFAFIDDFYRRWDSIKNGFQKSAGEYIVLFGESVYKQSLQNQFRQMSKYSSDPNTVANGLIISGNAFTNSKGQTNSNAGYKNEPHRNYGG